MSGQEEPARAPGYCSYCDKWTADGVVIKEIYGNSGPGAVVVRHPACVKSRRVVSVETPRTFPR